MFYLFFLYTLGKIWLRDLGASVRFFIFQSQQIGEVAVTLRRFQRLLPSWVAKNFVGHPSIAIVFTHVIQKGRIQKENPKSECLTVAQLNALVS